MIDLNYNHLWYFWNVAETGGVSAAARELGVAPATVSASVRGLERALGSELLERQGRDLVLTDLGDRVRVRARDIFSAGRDLLEDVRSESGRPARVTVGVSEALPKLVAREFLRATLQSPTTGTLRVRETNADVLIGELAAHRLDLVITDEPVRIPPGSQLTIVPLGVSPVGFFASPTLAKSLREEFPRSIAGAPALLPGPFTALRRSLDRWFATHNLHPEIVAEFDDPALSKVFAREGSGFVALPQVVSEEVIEENGFELCGVPEGCVETFYAVTSPRRSRRPEVDAVIEEAKEILAAAKG